MGTLKNMLCFGDSNTWGYDPETQTRFPFSVRWTGVLQECLGTDYRVIEEGLNGRMTNLDDPRELYRNGLAYLPVSLLSHKPLDLVVIMLGTNDIKRMVGRSSEGIAEAAAQLAATARAFPVGPADGQAAVLLVAPPPLSPVIEGREFLIGGLEKSRRFGVEYKAKAEELGLPFLDAGSVIKTSDLDGVHFEASEHRKLGEAIAAKVLEILG
jgi:lysophospholipase L1-like esterase